MKRKDPLKILTSQTKANVSFLMMSSPNGTISSNVDLNRRKLRKLLFTHYITVGRSGSVGKVHYYEQPTWAHNTALFVKDFKGNNPKYLYYLLKNLHLDNTFEKGSSVIPSLDRNLVHSLVVPFHKDINDQRKVVAVLSAIDRKIELNRQINDNLPTLDRSLKGAKVRLAA